jgi:hypothetical protein
MKMARCPWVLTADGLGDHPSFEFRFKQYLRKPKPEKDVGAGNQTSASGTFSLGSGDPIPDRNNRRQNLIEFLVLKNDHFIRLLQQTIGIQ